MTKPGRNANNGTGTTLRFTGSFSFLLDAGPQKPHTHTHSLTLLLGYLPVTGCRIPVGEPGANFNTPHQRFGQFAGTEKDQVLISLRPVFNLHCALAALEMLKGQKLAWAIHCFSHWNVVDRAFS